MEENIIPENSIPSERLLLICGLVDTAKQSNILGILTEKQVFLYKSIIKSLISIIYRWPGSMVNLNMTVFWVNP